MRFLKIFVIGAIIAVIVFSMWCCLVVASEDDDREGRD